MFDEIWQVLNSKNFSLAVTGFFIFGTIANIAGMIAFRGIEKDKNYIRHKEEIDELHRRLISQGFLEVQIFDGRLNLNKRKEILLSNSEVLILQIQTGCEGLNLQENYQELAI